MGSAEPLRQALTGDAAQLGAARRLVVGFSGGLDSTVLLHAAAAAFPGRVSAMHAHHGLHGDAGTWADHCEKACAAWNIPFESKRLSITDTGRGVEAAAREARYGWFKELLGSGDVLLLAHHLDDQAETLLLRLLRGAGPDGLAAMPQRRSLGEAELFRPFLNLPRSTLRAYAEEHHLRWIEDPANSASEFDRSYLRKEVLPLLEARWPGYRKTFGRAAEQLRAVAGSHAPQAPPTVLSVTGEPGFSLAAVPPGRDEAALVIRAWLRDRALPMPPSSKLGEFLRQLTEGDGASLATDLYVLTRYGDAVFCQRGTAPLRLLSHALEPGSSLTIPGVGQVRVEVSADTVSGSALFVRGRRAGDRIAAGGGQHRSVKKLLQELRLPPWWRDRVPLLCAGDEGQHRILAVGPYRRSDEARSMGVELFWSPDLGLAD